MKEKRKKAKNLGIGDHTNINPRKNKRVDITIIPSLFFLDFNRSGH